MRGYPLYNFPAFDRARDLLTEQGWEVISPADMDRSVDGFDPTAMAPDHDWNSVPAQIDFNECVERDLAAVKSCDAIYLLPHWEKSLGARAEHALAAWLGKEVLVAT
jgi:hypothetical protein